MPRLSAKGPAKRAAKLERDTLKAAGKGRGLFTADSYQNFMAKLGVGTDNQLSASTYGFNPITRQRTLLEWMHRGTWLGGVAIDLVADDMVRAGIEIQSTMDPADIAKLQQTLVHLNIWGEINAAAKWSRLYGGSLGIYVIDGQDVSTPLNVDRIGKDQFRGIMALDRWQVEPSMEDLVTDLGPDRGLPKYYTVVTDAPALRHKRVHYTRCFRMEGIPLPIQQRYGENLWGLSVLERLYDRMIAFDSATMGMAQLIFKSHLRTYKMKDLRTTIATGGDEGMRGLLLQVEMMRRFQTNEGITMLDMDDDMITQAQPVMTGISDALLQLGQQLSGALQIPLVRLFGQSPAGLNSTGESDLRTYYDGIKQQQERYLRIPIDTILRLTALSEGIEVPDDFIHIFNSLWQPKDEDKIKAGGDLTTAILAAYEAGVVDRETALKELRQSARITGMWSNITDKAIDEAEGEPPKSQMLEDAPGAEGATEGEGGNLDEKGTQPAAEGKSKLRAVE